MWQLRQIIEPCWLPGVVMTWHVVHLGFLLDPPEFFLPFAVNNPEDSGIRHQCV